MYRHANEISRKALTYIYQQKNASARFQKMTQDLGINERDLTKNLFWLEEHHLVKLSTSLPAGSTFPQIVVVRLTREGTELVSKPEKFSNRFPLDEPTTSTPLHNYRDVLRLLRDTVEADKGIDKKSRRDALASIDNLLEIPITDRKVGS